MKRLLVSIFACLIVLLNLVVADTTQAQSLTASPPSATVDTKARQEVMEKLKSEFIPQLESVLTPEQRDEL